jgi:hypothetical protein
MFPMKTIFGTLIVLAMMTFSASVHANTSPYVTTSTGVPLNQSTNDSINGNLATGDAPLEGSLSSLTDATSASDPTDNVIPGTDNTSTSMTWDLGSLVAPSNRKLDRVSIWISASDNVRRGLSSSIALSTNGIDFTEIPQTANDADLAFADGFFNNVVYDFSSTNITGFQYVRLTSLGHDPNGSGTSWQPRLVEVDINTTATVPEPSTVMLGVAAFGFVFGARRLRRL